MKKYEWGLQEATAVYTDASQIVGSNPFIEALPDVIDDEEIFRNLRTKIKVDRDALPQLPTQERIMLVDQIFDAFHPWDIHIRLSENIASAIRSGYTNRNPIRPEFVQQQRAIAAHIEQRDSSFSGLSNNAKATGFSVIGYSGMGKTSAVSRALAQYPQKIIHTTYCGKNFPFTQITWMKLNCPFDSSVKGLCIEFFQEFDRIMGENTYQRFAMSSRATTDLMLPQMALLASRHGLGALVIDEIQNLNEKKSRGKNQMLNFFTQLVNKIGVPVILVGTQSALEPLTSDLATARRFTGPNGSIIMDLLKKDSGGWELLLKGLSMNQWTDEKVDLLNSDIQDALYQESKGVVACVVSILAQTQKAAIRAGESKITAEMIRRVARSDENLMIRLLLKDIDKVSVSKSADRDFTLHLAQLRANLKEELPPTMVSDVQVENDPIIRQMGTRKKREAKAPIPTFEGDILKKSDPY